ncbi:Unknown protein [Striga hermonthica]|uniref:DUF4216 domain-containing protein n=1 Tax=Striga hermonthica TaxID=68872 RepID=A0A9N7MM57_STRHE|nr:Unknown protein [Striga hermonthica]
MMHLPIHLVDDVRLSGPVSGWWMFGPERYLGELKDYVRNRSRPEASIAEGYLDELVEKYIKEHEDMMKMMSQEKSKKRWRQAQQHSQEFVDWFKDKVELEQVPDHIKWLALGPSHVARRYTGYFINGYRFYTQGRDAKLKTQNSGVTLTALTSSFSSTKDLNPSVDGVTYYGRINDIIEIDYWSSFSVVLFRCEWFQENTDSYGLTCVNFNKLCYEDDPFVLASQVHQVFYVKDTTEKGCHYVMKKLSKDFIDIMDQTKDTYFSELTGSVEDRMVSTLNDDEENSWTREGVPPIILDDPVENQEANSESYDTGHC